MIYHNMWADVYSLPACLMMFVSESDVEQLAAKSKLPQLVVCCVPGGSLWSPTDTCTFASQLALAVWISLLSGVCSS